MDLPPANPSTISRNHHLASLSVFVGFHFICGAFFIFIFLTKQHKKKGAESIRVICYVVFISHTSNSNKVRMNKLSCHCFLIYFGLVEICYYCDSDTSKSPSNEALVLLSNSDKSHLSI